MRYSMVVIASALCAVPILAETENWSQMAIEDLEAAHGLIAENHPGAEPDHGDTGFIQALAEGYAEARTRAEAARDYAGYRAALLSFAASFRDGHVWSRARFEPTYSWPGFFVSLVDDEWRVLPHQNENGPPVGSRLLSCDGNTADQIASETLAPFNAGWSIPAARKMRSIRLLVDRGEVPYLRFAQCRFSRQDGAEIDVALNWQDMDPREYNDLASAARPRAARENVLSQWRDGWWIRIASLSSEANELADAIAEQRDAVTGSPYVIVDLRGNGGGNSAYSDRLAVLLYGSDAFDAAQAGLHAEGGNTVWRVSSGNRAQLEDYIVRFEDRPEFVAETERQRDAMIEAEAAGRPLSTIEAVSEEDTEGEAFAAPAVMPRVVLITDGSCFSSCLLAADLFRNLGALHIGQETNANTHYSEVREIDLPSGLSTFSTLQAFIPSMPVQIGPYTPEIVLSDAALANEDMLRAEVAHILELPEE